MADWFDESDVEKAAQVALEKEFELEGLTKKQREFQWNALEEEERFLHKARMRAALSAVKPKSEWVDGRDAAANFIDARAAELRGDGESVTANAMALIFADLAKDVRNLPPAPTEE